MTTRAMRRAAATERTLLLLLLGAIITKLGMLFCIRDDCQYNYDQCSFASYHCRWCFLYMQCKGDKTISKVLKHLYLCFYISISISIYISISISISISIYYFLKISIPVSTYLCLYISTLKVRTDVIRFSCLWLALYVLIYIHYQKNCLRHRLKVTGT